MMKKHFILALMTLTVITNNVSAQTEPNKQSSMMKMTMDHSHLPIAAPSNAPKPALSLSLTKDAMSGYNLHLQLARYQLMPPPEGVVSMSELMSATRDQETGFIEGHAHLYINGIKIQRVYGLDVHLPATHFKQGVNTVSVTLNNHGHMYWTVDEKKVVSTLYIDDTLPQLIKHKFDSFPVENTG